MPRYIGFLEMRFGPDSTNDSARSTLTGFTVVPSRRNCTKEPTIIHPDPAAIPAALSREDRVATDCLAYRAWASAAPPATASGGTRGVLTSYPPEASPLRDSITRFRNRAPSPSTKSSLRTSPGWIGANLSVIVNDSHLLWSSGCPYEADPPPIVHPHAALLARSPNASSRYPGGTQGSSRASADPWQTLRSATRRSQMREPPVECLHALSVFVTTASAPNSTTFRRRATLRCLGVMPASCERLPHPRRRPRRASRCRVRCARPSTANTRPHGAAPGPTEVRVHA